MQRRFACHSSNVVSILNYSTIQARPPSHDERSVEYNDPNCGTERAATTRMLMREGFVYLETRSDKPGLVRLGASEKRPALRLTSGMVRYIARYQDMDTGKMHVHLTLHRQLLDINRDLYRVELADAMAAIEADGLRHERDWIDPDISETDLRRFEQRVQRLRIRQRRLDTVCRCVGIGAIILLMLSAFLGM